MGWVVHSIFTAIHLRLKEISAVEVLLSFQEEIFEFIENFAAVSIDSGLQFNEISIAVALRRQTRNKDRRFCNDSVPFRFN